MRIDSAASCFLSWTHLSKRDWYHALLWLGNVLLLLLLVNIDGAADRRRVLSVGVRVAGRHGLGGIRAVRIRISLSVQDLVYDITRVVTVVVVMVDGGILQETEKMHNETDMHIKLKR